jgi:hypothetical protein
VPQVERVRLQLLGDAVLVPHGFLTIEGKLFRPEAPTLRLLAIEGELFLPEAPTLLLLVLREAGLVPQVERVRLQL